MVTLFCLLAASLLLYALVDGWRGQAVWVKGVGVASLSLSPRGWFYRVSRSDQPAQYWVAMLAYGAGLLLVAYVAVQGVPTR